MVPGFPSNDFLGQEPGTEAQIEEFCRLRQVDRKTYRKQLLQLQEWIKSSRLEAVGGPLWARYKAPFTPWFMRRNEILIPMDS